MVQAGVGGLDTPRTNLGDATYLTNQFDFDISQEQSFQSPSKDNNNLVQQLQNGRRGGAVNLRTPRGRAPFGDRRNLPAGLGGGEFTPLLKSATRNSALRHGKENGVPQTPAFLKLGGLGDVPEELTPLPTMGSSIYDQDSRNGSYMGGTPMPQVESSSAASTPMALLPRRSDGPGVLQDGNQLSLREQENVIDKIEKENFGLKLKIHFLEEALRKAGPGFSEAALKENTELKVDKVTMQKELHRYRKTLTAAERDVELYRQQIIEMQESSKRKYADEGQREELDQLRRKLQEKEEELYQLRDKFNDVKQQDGELDDLQDKIQDLEADLREKDRIIDDREDEVDSMKEKVEEHASTISDLQEAMKKSQRQALLMEEMAQSSEDLAEAKEAIEELELDLQRQKNEIEDIKRDTRDTIEGLEHDLQGRKKEIEEIKQDTKDTIEEMASELERLKQEVEDIKEDREEALREKEHALADLEELQNEMSNKSITTKGLSRQIEEKANRLQEDLEEVQDKYALLEEQHVIKTHEASKLQDKIEDLLKGSNMREQNLRDELELVQNENQAGIEERENLAAKLDQLQQELHQKIEEKDLLHIRHDALTSESAGLQRELARSQTTIEDLEDRLNHEKTLAINNEQDVRSQYKDEIDRLNDEIEDVRADLRESQRVHDDDNDKWDIEKRNLESERERVEERAAGLQRTIDRLQKAEGTLSGKEINLQDALQSEKERHQSQEALLTRQINGLNEDIQTRQKAFEEARLELSDVREELRLNKREQKLLVDKVEGLEDEIEILQNSLDDESDHARQQLAVAKQESEDFQRQVQTLKADLVKADSIHTDDMNQKQFNSLLREVEEQLARVRQEKQNLQDQLANVNIELHSIRSSSTKFEAERDEVKSQLRAMKEQEEETFRLDEERINLRTAQMKLDSELRRLRHEHKIAVDQQHIVEKELQREIDRAGAEEARLNLEIQELRNKVKGTSENELASAKRIIKHLEERINELEGQITSGDGYNDAASQLEIARQHLSSARKKEVEYIQREGAQKDVLKGLLRQVKELERKSNENDISQLSAPSPLASTKGSARKSEVLEVRHQLAIAHQTLKDLRSQLKEVERDTSRKLKSISYDNQVKADALESERDGIQLDLDEAIFQKGQLTAKNASAEATIARLRSKIERLEQELQAERVNSGEDRTMALERRDLHEMLRETQLQAETLEVVIKERERTIASVTASEQELRAKLERVRDERALQRTKIVSAQDQILHLERQFRKSKETWEAEKKALTRGVRFSNTSMSEGGHKPIHKQAGEEREIRHNKELRGLAMQIEYLQASLVREQNLRSNAAYIKDMLQRRIDFFKACNKADLKLLGVPPRERVHKKPSLKGVVSMVIATTRMRKMAVEWQKNLAINQKLQSCLKDMRKKQAGKGTSNV